MKKLRNITLWIALLLLLGSGEGLYAQKDKVAEQQRIIDNLERSIEREEQELAKLKKNKATQQKRAKSLARQIERRTALISTRTRQISRLNTEVAASEQRLEELAANIARLEQSVREMARAAYRNYRNTNTLTHLLSAGSATEFAHRVAALRCASMSRSEQIERVVELRKKEQEERTKLSARRSELAANKKKLSQQRQRLQGDMQAAKSTISRMSKRERNVLQSLAEHEKSLNKAIAELRKMTKGNREGSTFNAATSGLRLPLAGGKVAQYNGNMAEIVGAKGAKVTSIYEGKVMKISRNKVNNKYEVYIAHGEYISAYANLASVVVKRGDTVARNGQIGTVGTMVNPATMELQYKIVFSIHSPSPKIKVRASALFAK